MVDKGYIVLNTGLIHATLYPCDSIFFKSVTMLKNNIELHW